MRKSWVVLAILSFGFARPVAAELKEVKLDLKWRTSQYAKIEGNILTVDVPESARTGTYSASATIDLTPFDGKVFQTEVEIAGTNIAPNPTSWLGLKFMLSYTDPDSGTKYYPQASKQEGTFAKRKFSFFEYQTDGHRGKTGTLMLGFQQTCGKAVFDLSTLKFYIGTDIWAQMPWAPRTNEEYVVSYPVHVTNGPPLRGVMLPSAHCKEDDFRTLAEWGATLGRYQMTSGPTPNAGESQAAYLVRYDAWLKDKLDHLDREALPWAVKYGLKLVVDLHSPPGGRFENDHDFRLFDDEVYLARFLQIWRDIATRFKGRVGIYGYDLYNEPYQERETRWDYWTVQRLAAEEIRKIDPDATIIIESSGMDSANAYAYISPLAMDNVIYQFHFYTPGEFTHQGVNSNNVTNHYPDAEKGWNREYLKRQMEPVRKFEAKHHAKIYVGEFSAIAWGEGSDQYIADCISIFNEYGWDWTYHAFREWTGWSVEHETVRGGAARASTDNPRKRALLAGMNAPDGFGVTATTVVDDTFEGVSEGVTVTQMHNGWTGGGRVVAETYAPSLPPGYPVPTVTHEKVLDIGFDEAARDISSTNSANRVLDMMVKVSTGRLTDETAADIRCAVALDGEGRFNVWHAFDEGGVRKRGWTVLSPTVYRNGEWVRLGIESRQSAAKETFYRLRINGSYCPTARGVRSPDAPEPFGAWYRSAVDDTASATLLGFVDTRVDDLRATAESVAPAHTGPTATNGVELAWFDKWGLPRRPDAAAPFLAGYTLRDVYRSGVHPYSDEPFRVTGLSWDADGRLNLTVNGYKGDEAALGYEVLAAPQPDGTYEALTTGAFSGDPESWSSTWRGDAPNGAASFFRVRSK